jgi:hypothetical protein
MEGGFPDEAQENPMAQRDRDESTGTTTTSTSTTTASPDQGSGRARTKEASSEAEKPFETAASLFAISIPPALERKVETVEVEFVHDGKGDFKAPSVGYKGAKVTERVQQGAPPHAIVTVRAKAPERNEDTGIRSEDRTLDFTGAALSYAVGNVGGLALNERNSIPLLGTLPAGDAPKAVSEGLVATG